MLYRSYVKSNKKRCKAFLDNSKQPTNRQNTMASNTASPSLKPRRGKAKTIPSGSVSASVIPASAAPAEELGDVAGKLDSIMLRLENLNVLDQLVVQVTNLTKSLDFCHESIAELKRENVELRTRVTDSEQIPKEWQDRRKALLPAFKDAKRQGKRARFVGDKFLVEGQFVTPNTSQHA